MQAPNTVAMVNRAMQLPREAIEKLRFDPMTAKRALARGLQYLEARRQTLLDTLPGLALDELRALPGTCDQIMLAQGQVKRLREPSNLELNQVMAVAMAWRRRLLPVSRALVSNGALVEADLAPMTARSRRIGTLLGLSDLCELLLPHLTAVEALAGPGALTQAAAAAEAAKQLLGHARVDSGALEEAIELRDRLATLVLHGHDRMRVYVALLSSFQEAERIVRPLHPYRGRRRRSPGAEVPEGHDAET